MYYTVYWSACCRFDFEGKIHVRFSFVLYLDLVCNLQLPNSHFF